ncbi:MAG: AAA family ATPase [Pirellulales bacterium]
MNGDAVEPLREAVRLSPDNRPLRQHLAATLLSLGRFDEAELEYRDALARWPDEDGLKLGLADAYFQQGKFSHAMVIVESLVKRQDTPARAYLIHARLLVQAGEVDFAVRQYKTAVSEDPSVADLAFAQRLGIGADAERDELVDGRLRASWDDSDGPDEQTVERPKIKFADVGGMEAVKEEIRMKIIYPLEHAEMFKAYGKAIGGGILMYGPPGCGKTYLARATAGEINAGFLSIGINDVLDMWIGNSERNLHELFEQARRNRPCVLFFDEVDALGASRSDMRHSAGRHLVNQFLSELDGVEANNDGVLILAATNAPWHVDAAFRRPGRFDRILFVPPPDGPARSEVLRVLLRGKPAQDVDFDHIAKKTGEFSGADMKAVVEAAIEVKLREAMKAGRPTPLATRDLQTAIKSVRPSTKEWFATARNYALYSNQGGLYDDILTYLKLK